MRGLEPDIQRLMQRHREETQRLEEQLREEGRRELGAPRPHRSRGFVRHPRPDVRARAVQARSACACSTR